ncbi:MAG: hypothetical protein ACHQ1G_11780, partial [Planctomycetota bacterium]
SQPAPDRLPDVARRVRILEHAPEAQQILQDLVREAARRGAAAVEELRARLFDEPDVMLERRWTFENGRVRGFPTLRSAYLSALLEIPGPEARDALLEAIALTRSADEAYQIAAGLERRGEGGFAGAAIDRALGAGPGDVDVARELMGLAARAEPEMTAKEIVARSPRGEDGTDPAMLGLGLEAMPVAQAFSTAKGLLADPDVTRQGKQRYLQSLCDRGEPELLASLREVANEGFLDRELRITMAYRAVGSAAFYADRAAYAAADPGSASDARAQIRARYERRLAEAELLIDAAVPDGEGSALVLESLRTRLADQASKLR